MYSFRSLLKPQSPLLRQISPLARLLSTEIPKNYLLDDIPSHLVFKTARGEYDSSKPRAGVRPEIWQVFVSTLYRVELVPTKRPKKSALHWLVMNANSREELDMAVELHEPWRMQMYTITQATAQIWSESCIRLNQPSVFLHLLLDRWRYRLLPISYTLARFIRFLGSIAAQDNKESVLDDAFRVFALYPYYNVPYDAAAYGALVEACLAVGSEEAWRRALVAAEEAIACDLVTREALELLAARSGERGEARMAERYAALAADPKFPSMPKKEVTFNRKGDPVY
ncbi:hypothetical protein BX070DRAFT_83711 [Coemansia spiralis]|nr:hypothetical protein BX070DRAFT_83711 [Coemansia spiralis]